MSSSYRRQVNAVSRHDPLQFAKKRFSMGSDCGISFGRRVWWVLDYKLRHRPQQLAAYGEQMHRYREAVRRAQPGDEVRCAFVTGAGEVVELEAGSNK